MNDSRYLNCSQANGDSPSPLKPKVSEALGSARSSDGQMSSDNIGIPKSQTSEIAPLPASPIEFAKRAGRLMSLREAFRASLRALSESGLALPMPDGYGLTQSASVASYDPDSRSLRTHQLCLLSNPGEPSTELFQDFPRSGMIVCGNLFPLPSLVPAICVGESASSLPTLDTQPHRKNANANATKWGGNNSVGSYAAAMLPTVRAGKHTSEDAESWQIRNNAGKVSTKPLALAVMLPTVNANRGGPDLNCSDRGFGDDLVTRMHRLLPTVTASAGGKEPEGKTGRKLVTVAQGSLLATPTTRDYKDTPGMTAERKDGKGREDTLPRQIYADGSTVPIGGMKLTPAFLSWLMGYPPDWLNPLQDAPEMQFVPRRGVQSPEPSMKV